MTSGKRSKKQRHIGGGVPRQPRRHDHDTGDSEGIEGVWIKSEPDESGQYHLYLELSEDDVIPLSVEDAWGWVREMQAAMLMAQHDAAVIRQLTEVQERGGHPHEEALKNAAHMVAELRADRPPFTTMPKLEFELVPGVSQRTGKGFVQLQRKGKPTGQWDPEDVDDHTLGVIRAILNLPLDSQYLRFCDTKLGVGRDRALAVVGDLLNHRDQS